MLALFQVADHIFRTSPSLYLEIVGIIGARERYGPIGNVLTNLFIAVPSG